MNNELENKYLKKLFLIDGVGAIVSALLLGVLLVQFQPYFGIPKSTLYFLAGLPCVFATYDFYCYFKIDRNLGRFLKVTALANLIYCCLSIGLAVYHSQETTSLGWMYIIAEVIIVAVLAFIELKAARDYIKK